MANLRIVGMALMSGVVLATLAWLSLAPATHSTASPPPARPALGGHGPHAADETDEADDVEPDSREPPGHLCRVLACSPAQRERIDPITAAYDRRAAELREDLEAQRSALEPLWQGETIDQAAVRVVTKDLEDTRLALDDAALQALLAVHRQLTPDQRQKLARMIGRRGFVGALEGPKHRRRGRSAE